MVRLVKLLFICQRCDFFSLCSDLWFPWFFDEKLILIDLHVFSPLINSIHNSTVPSLCVIEIKAFKFWHFAHSSDRLASEQSLSMYLLFVCNYYDSKTDRRLLCHFILWPGTSRAFHVRLLFGRIAYQFGRHLNLLCNFNAAVRNAKLGNTRCLRRPLTSPVFEGFV